MKRITWHLEGRTTRKSITKAGVGVQQVFATLDRRDRWDITIYGTRVTMEEVR